MVVRSRMRRAGKESAFDTAMGGYKMEGPNLTLPNLSGLPSLKEKK